MEGAATGGSWAVVFSGLLQSISFVLSDDWILMYFCCLHISHHRLMDDEPSLNSVCNNVNARCSVTAATDVLHSISSFLSGDCILIYFFSCVHIYHEWITFVLFSHSNAQSHSNAGINHGDQAAYASNPAKILRSSRYTETGCSDWAHLEPHSLMNSTEYKDWLVGGPANWRDPVGRPPWKTIL